MGTTTKALSLLNHFTVRAPALGLSDLARQSGFDKATTYRLLGELTHAGLTEQDPNSKLFRLGPALIRYANLREQTLPVRRAAAQHLARLAEAVQETAHVSELQGHVLSPVASHISTFHSTRVHIDSAELLPLYATASGCAVLAFGDTTLVNEILAHPMPRITPHTQVKPEQLRAKIQIARTTGFGDSENEFETGVSSIAAPLFSAQGRCTGALALACPLHRMTHELRNLAKRELITSATAITQAWGGTIPPALNEIWNRQTAG